ncbi:transposase [Cellulomonas sp. JH27-2]|nr:transposase [Cellulomonas sp. JH27-2]
MRRTRPALSRAGANHKNRTRDAVHDEPAGHAIGRSLGGLTTKIHHAFDGRGRPLVAVVTAGQSHDGQQLKAVLDDIWVSRASSGRPRTTSDALLRDKAYSSAATRVLNRPGMSGDSVRWEGWGHVREHVQEVSA